MATAAQILANRQNAELSSCDPVTAACRSRVSQNATELGPFQVANFVRPEERDIFKITYLHNGRSERATVTDGDVVKELVA